MDPITAIALSKLLLELAIEWKDAMKQKGEWTDEQEAKFKADWEFMRNQDHWKIEP
jgi:hypothetical protein